ncbi:MAG: cytochrome P450 [Burkholderiales bacterium]|nr:cytochrome P450 [Burkholderiales bacterium]
MHIEVRRLSCWDTLRLLVLLVLPSFLWGAVAANRRLVGLLVRLDAGRRILSLLEQLRVKYGCNHLWTWFPLRKTLLVLDPESADALLRSDANAADPALKKRAVSRFAPGALVISSGAEWPDRRVFNEAALGFGALHPHCDAFRAIAVDEAGRLVGDGVSALRWPEFERLGMRVSHQVIFGRGRIEPAMAGHLARLVARGNWLLPRHRRAYAALHAAIDEHLARHRARAETGPRSDGAPTSSACLMHDAAALAEKQGFASSIRAASQVAFWLFVLKDAVELHVARTLALIAAHAEVQERVRQEVRAPPHPGTRDVDRFTYLEACISEQLRLWTPVPILLRRATRPFRLRGGDPGGGRGADADPRRPFPPQSGPGRRARRPLFSGRRDRGVAAGLLLQPSPAVVRRSVPRALRAEGRARGAARASPVRARPPGHRAGPDSPPV